MVAATCWYSRAESMDGESGERVDIFERRGPTPGSASDRTSARAAGSQAVRDPGGLARESTQVGAAGGRTPAAVVVRPGRRSAQDTQRQWSTSRRLNGKCGPIPSL